MPQPEFKPLVASRHLGASHHTIAELVSIACTLLILPATVLYCAGIVAVALQAIVLQGNLLLSMLFALSGFSLFFIAIVGSTATIIQSWRSGRMSRFATIGLSTQVAIIIAMLVLWISGWQLTA